MTDQRQVLIVEDDHATRMLLETILRRSGVTATSAADGGRAIELLEDQKFDLVILDLMMPHIGGADVIRHLAGATRRPPVIVCTAAGVAATRDLPREIVSAVLRKPFDIVELMATVAELTNRETERETTTLPRVLIVDDESDARFVMRTLAGPAEVLEAESGEEALQLVREHRPDAILLDLMLPGISGEDLLQQLRSDPSTSAIPIIVVTARQLSEEDRSHILRFCSAFIQKSDLTREHLHEVLHVVLKAQA